MARNSRSSLSFFTAREFFFFLVSLQLKTYRSAGSPLCGARILFSMSVQMFNGWCHFTSMKKSLLLSFIYFLRKSFSSRCCVVLLWCCCLDLPSFWNVLKFFFPLLLEVECSMGNLCKICLKESGNGILLVVGYFIFA